MDNATDKYKFNVCVVIFDNIDPDRTAENANCYII